MRSILIVLAVAALAACNAKAMQGLIGESPGDALVEAPLASAQMRYQQGGYTDAQQALEQAVQPAMLDHFSPGRRREVIDLYAQSAWFGGDYDRAHWAWKVATQDPQATADEWQGRLMSAAAVLDNADAYVAFAHMQRESPDAIRAITPRLLEQIDSDFGVLPNGATARLQLAEVLYPTDETDPRANYSPMWLQAATTSLAQGQMDQAAKYARRITAPVVMAELRADRRFDGLVAADPAAYDVNALAQSQLAKAEALAAAQPDRLAAKLALATALYNVDRYPDALATLDAGLAQGPTYGEDPSYPLDLVARRATVLIELGRNDEAVAVASTACAVCGRNGRFNLQQAHLLIGLKRGAAARPLLEGDQPPGLNVVGVAEVAAMRACADHEAGRSADAARQLSFLRSNMRYNPDATLGALLCAGSDGEVASSLEAMLADGQMRAVALGDLQVYHEGKLLPLTQDLRTRLATIAARPEVKAAIDKVGRVTTYNVPRYAVLG